MRRGQLAGLSLYVRALPLYARNLGVALPPLVAALIMILLTWLAGPVFAPVGGAGASLFGIIAQLIAGFALGVAIIFADDAWRHGRARIQSAWHEGRRKAGNILLTTLGFFFIVYVAGLVGGLLGPMFAYAAEAVALFFLIYSLPAAAIGGVPAQGAFSTSIRTARNYPLPTAILALVCAAVGFWLPPYLSAMLQPYVSPIGWMAFEVLFTCIAQGYVALVLAKQYSDFAFSGSYW